jgi:hypothetical protein
MLVAAMLDSLSELKIKATAAKSRPDLKTANASRESVFFGVLRENLRLGMSNA